MLVCNKNMDILALTKSIMIVTLGVLFLTVDSTHSINMHIHVCIYNYVYFVLFYI